MSQPVIVSIIINNYNYARYLRQSIDSALQQTYPHCEIIIVDDGSTDNSRNIINEYTHLARIVLKENGGQASAFNAGFNVSKGELVLFLDADDRLHPDAAFEAVSNWKGNATSKLHWSLRVIDSEGAETGDITPQDKLPQGDLIQEIIALGPNAYLSSPTTGNAWSRRFLKKVLPMPEEPFAISADNYLCMLAPLYGEVQVIDQPLGFYRLHGENSFRGKVMDEAWLQARVDRYTFSCKILKKHLAKQRIRANVDKWHEQSWLMRMSRSFRDIRVHVPAYSSFILADADQWQVGQQLSSRNIIPFVEKDNQYWGLPSDDDDAIREIERHREAGYIFFAWPVFWFKDHYQKLFDYLGSQHFCVIDNDRLLGYKLFRQA